MPARGEDGVRCSQNVLPVVLPGFVKPVLTEVPPCEGPSQPWSFDLPSDRLQRLNQITIVPGAKGSLEVSRLRIEYGGRSFGDVRFGPTTKRRADRPAKGRAPLDYYIDLTYPGQRGTP